jgi:hypothetical protein
MSRDLQNVNKIVFNYASVGTAASYFAYTPSGLFNDFHGNNNWRRESSKFLIDVSAGIGQVYQQEKWTACVCVCVCLRWS